MALAGVLIFCHSVLLQLWGHPLDGISAPQVAALRRSPNQLPVIGDTQFFRCGHNCNLCVEHWTNKGYIAEKGLISWNYVKRQFGLVVSQFKQVFVLSASKDSCPLSMQMITCMCMQNCTALTCDLYCFDHPGVTVLCMWMWKWWSDYLIGA